jgi:hypothetical protein
MATSSRIKFESREATGRQLLPFAPKSGHAVEHGVEQGAKARALVQAGKNLPGLLLENSVTDIVGSTFQERTHAFLGRLHMKLESEHALTHCKSLRLRYLALDEQRCIARQVECLAMPVEWCKAIG